MATPKKTTGTGTAPRTSGKTARPEGTRKLDDRIVRIFLKSVGSEAGLYQAAKKDFAPDLELHHLYQANLEIVRSVLKEKRMSADELERFILERYNAGERQVLLSDILPRQAPARDYRETDNLIQAGTVYQHAALYERTAPAYSFAGRQVVTVRQGEGKPKAEFTLRELVQYYLEHVKTAYRAARMEKLYGGFRYLLDVWRLDEVLTAIDLAGETQRDISVVKLEDFLPQARQEVKMKAARAREG